MCLFLGPEIGGVSSKELVCRKVATCMFTPSELKAFSKPARPGKEKGSVEGAHRARLANGVMLIIQQDATYFVCCKLADGDGDEIKVHFFNGSGGLYQTRRYRPVYVDPKDEKEIFTRTPKATYQAFTSFVKVATVVARDFSLTKQYTVPAKVWKTLPELKPDLCHPRPYLMKLMKRRLALRRTSSNLSPTCRSLTMSSRAWTKLRGK